MSDRLKIAGRGHAASPTARHRAGMAAWSAVALGMGLAVSVATHALAADVKSGDLTIAHPWSRATPAGAQVAAGYMVIRNEGGTADRLVSVSSEIADRSEIHQMGVDAKGIMTMRPVEAGIEIPAGGEVALQPGSFHLMFVGLKKAPKQGDVFGAVLTFERAGEIKVEFDVQAISGGMGGPMKHGG